MIMNDDIGEMESVGSLGEESSSSSSNDEPSSQSEVDSSNNTDSEFHGRQILIEKRSVRNRPKACVKACQNERWIPNYGRTIKTRADISNQGRRTVRTRGGVQNCWTGDAAHTFHLQLNKTMGVNVGSKEQHNNIIDESTNSSDQQYVSIDDGNADESNANINISETSAVDEDNRSGNETNNNNWSKDDLVIKIFPFSETQIWFRMSC